MLGFLKWTNSDLFRGGLKCSVVLARKGHHCLTRPMKLWGYRAMELWSYEAVEL